MKIERTLVLIKPDGVQRGLCGDILSRFEHKGIRILGIKLLSMSPSMAIEHYVEHKGKPFFDDLLNYITSSSVMAVALEGPNAIVAVRRLLGSTKPEEAAPGTIRGDLALHVDRNLVHGSEHEFDAKHEIPRFFLDEELIDWAWDEVGIAA